MAVEAAVVMEAAVVVKAQVVVMAELAVVMAQVVVASATVEAAQKASNRCAAHSRHNRCHDRNWSLVSPMSRPDRCH